MKTEVPAATVVVNLRQALNRLGEMTGQITTDDLLATIFFAVLHWEVKMYQEKSNSATHLF